MKNATLVGIIVLAVIVAVSKLRPRQDGFVFNEPSAYPTGEVDFYAVSNVFYYKNVMSGDVVGYTNWAQGSDWMIFSNAPSYFFPRPAEAAGVPGTNDMPPLDEIMADMVAFQDELTEEELDWYVETNRARLR